MTSTRKYDFSNKVALVTGSSSGIGAAIAKQLAQYGAKLTITGLIEEHVEETANEIKELTGHEPLQIVGTLTDEHMPRLLVEQTVEKYGRLDFLVNNAGHAFIDEPLESEKILDDYDYLLKLNVRAPMELIHFSVKHLEKTKGNIVNMSSVAAKNPVRIIQYCSFSFCPTFSNFWPTR